MARLRTGTKHILTTARETKNFSKQGRNELAKRIKSSRRLARSNYKHQGKLVTKLKGSTYGHKVFPSHL